MTAEWRDDRKYVLNTLGKLEEKMDRVLANDHNHDKRIDRVEYKSGLFGTIGGALGFFLLVGLEWIKNKLAH